jgi:hypothetical protein
VWKCKGVLHKKEPVYDFYTQSELEWMLVEVNLLWRREHRGNDGRIPFFCKYCGVTMKNKHHLGYHRKRNECPDYCVPTNEPLKMFPILPSSVTQGVLRELFSSLSLPLPSACGRKATANDEGDTSDDEQAVLDLEDKGVSDVQGPIILSEEEDSKFDDDVTLVFKGGVYSA